MTFEWDGRVLTAFEEGLAAGCADWGAELADRVRAMAGPHRKSGRYIRGIFSSTYVGDRLVAGPAVRNIARVPAARSRLRIRTVVAARTRAGYWLERGTKPHPIRVEAPAAGAARRGTLVRTIRHPGSRVFPHFGPATMSLVSRIAPTIEAALARRGFR